MRKDLVCLTLTVGLTLSMHLPVTGETDSNAHQALRDSTDLSPPPSVDQNVNKVFAIDGRPRVIVVLGGGGCKTVAQIGVLRSLVRHHVPITGIVGTSVGATIGAMYCAGIPLDDIEQSFLDGSMQHAMVSHIAIKTLLHPLLNLPNLVTHAHYGGLTSGQRFERFLAKQLPPSFNDLQKPFAAVATDITDGETAVLTKGNLPEAIRASGSMPALFRPELIDGKLYVDGGLKANLPARIARQLGADIVIAVSVDTSIKHEPNKKFRSIKAVVSRTTDIMIAAADKQQANSSDIFIYPDADDISLVTKNPDLIRKGVAAGEAATDRVIPEILQEIALKQSGQTASAGKLQ